MKFTCGAIENLSTGNKADIIVPAFTSSEVKHMIIGMGIVLIGCGYLFIASRLSGMDKLLDGIMAAIKDVASSKNEQ